MLLNYCMICNLIYPLFYCDATSMIKAILGVFDFSRVLGKTGDGFMRFSSWWCGYWVDLILFQLVNANFVNEMFDMSTNLACYIQTRAQPICRMNMLVKRSSFVSVVSVLVFMHWLETDRESSFACRSWGETWWFLN